MSEIDTLKTMFAKLNATIIEDDFSEDYFITIEGNGEKVRMWFKLYHGALKWEVRAKRKGETRTSIITSAKLIRDLNTYAMNR